MRAGPEEVVTIDIPVAADCAVKCTTTEIEHMEKERLQNLINGHSVRSCWLLNALARQALPAKSEDLRL